MTRVVKAITCISIAVILTLTAIGLSSRPVSAQIIPCRPFDRAKEDPPFCAGDHRVNAYDAAAPITAYCEADGSLNVWGITNVGQGFFLYNVSGAQLAQALQNAESASQDEMIQGQDGRDLWALHSGKLELHDEGTGYTFIFAGDACGSVPANVDTGNQDNSAAQNQPDLVFPTLTDTPAPTSTATAPTPDALNDVAAPASGFVSITTGYMKLHKSDNPVSDVLAYVPRGAAIAVFGRDYSWNWVKISYRGIPGWVSSQYAGLTDAQMRQLLIVR